MQKKTVLALLFACLVVLSACGGGGEKGAEPAGEPTATPSGDAGAKKVDPATAGNIAGKVNYSGSAEQGARIRMGADPSCAEQHSAPVYSEDLEVNSNGTLRNAFVYVKDGLDGYTFDTPSTPAELDQHGCLYKPHVLGVQVNQEIKIVNSDPTTHNIHPVPMANREWNTSQAPNVDPLVKSFPRAEVMIPVKCNVHPWMKAYIGVVSNPYFAVTGEDGSFELKGLPPGEYTVEAWHEKLGAKEMKVTVASGQTQESDFSFGG